jgi:spore germination cell wall hydrolase CwlJ-like protein
MSDFNDINDESLFAICLWGEARGASMEAKIAMANVIWNRHKMWKKTLKDVILKPKQFSCFNEDDKNRPKMLEVLNQEPLVDVDYWECYWVAWGVMYEYLKNNIGKACYYNTKGCDPTWDDKMKLVKVIGNTEFFADV